MRASRFARRRSRSFLPFLLCVSSLPGWSQRSAPPAVLTDRARAGLVHRVGSPGLLSPQQLPRTRPSVPVGAPGTALGWSPSSIEAYWAVVEHLCKSNLDCRETSQATTGQGGADCWYTQINFQRRVAERRLPAVAWQRLFLLRRCALGKPKRTLRRRAVMPDASG